MDLPKTRQFDAKAFLNSPGVARKVVDYRPAATIYSQGDPSDTVLYIQRGSVKLSVLSQTGKEAIVGVLGAGEFFGEGALAGQPVRLATATAMTASRVRVIAKRQMIRLLHQQHALSDRFIAYMLARNARLEEDLVDQLFNASEKRLARTLLLLARYGKPDGPRHVLPRISQEVLAEMVGTTRSRMNFFMTSSGNLASSITTAASRFTTLSSVSCYTTPRRPITEGQLDTAESLFGAEARPSTADRRRGS